METKKDAVSVYRGRLRLLLAVSGGTTALCVAVETLIWALSALGVSRPENALHAVNTYILGANGYKIAAFILAALTVFLYVRYSRVRTERSDFRYAAFALAVRECTLAVTELARFALKLLGISGGVDPLVSPDGYLVRMVEPILNVLSDAVVLVFSVVYLCAYLVAVGERENA